MIRNFVAGTLWGVVVAGVGLAVVSQVAPMPGNRSGGATDLAGANPVAAPEGVAAVVPKAGSAPVAPDVKLPAPVESVPAKAAPANTVPAAPPAAPAAPAPAAPALEPAALEPAAPAPAPAVLAETKPASPAIIAPPAPPVQGDSDDQLALGEAATPPGARTTAPAVAEAPLALDAPDAAATVPVLPSPADPQPAVTLPAVTLPAVTLPGDAPVADQTDAVPGTVDAPPPAPPLAPEALLDPAPQIKANPAPATIAPEVPVENAVPLPQATADAPAAAVPAPETEPETAVLKPVAPLRPAPGLIARDQPSAASPDTPVDAAEDGVTTNRLPSIGAPSTEQAEAADTAPPVDMRPVQQFAQRFDNPSGKPLFAVILRDTGAADVDRAALAALPFPVSFAIDPLAPNAAEAAAIYRAAGQEVILLASGIPPGAQASDLEQTFQTTAAVLPQAVAVMDLALNGFQDDRPLASLVVPIVKTQGRGLITFDRGLNAADQVARREDVPSATIFRQLDGAGEDVPLIRRYLDRAAFKAAQEGRVMVLGDTRAETIAALMEWTVEGRASSVTLAPATAVLLVD